MEDLRSSRRPAKPAYGDVFCGGAHKYSSTPSAAKSDNYAEIFGGVAASCSIPFLDLPPPQAERYDSNGGVPIDYSEIFGGFDGGSFAVDYEDLFKKTAETSAASNGRVQVDANFGYHAEGLDFSPVRARKDYGASSGKKNFSSSSNHSDDGSKEFSMSFHRTTRGSIEDVISGKTHITQLHAVPGYNYMVNSCSSQDVKSDNSTNIQTSDLTDVSQYGRPNDLGQEKRAQPTSSTDYANRDGADLRTHQKETQEYSAKYAASEDDPVNGKYHSRSSSNYSASSGDIPYPGVTYVSISEINLRTQPSRMPPPSRAPPKLASKQEHTKSHQIHYRVGASKSHGVQGVAKDVEVDTSSAAAASAAAMKEAMEQAQARLKSAKELMERKQDNLQSRKKLGHKEGSKYDERKEVIASVEETPLSEVAAMKPLPKGDKGVKEYTLDDMQKVIKVGKVALDHEERERYATTAEQSRQMRQGNGFKASQMSYKSEEVSGEWKTEEQFYELINNEKKFRAVKEALKQEDVEKNTKTSREVNEDKENGPEKDEQTNEFRRTVQLHKVNETIQRNEIDDRSKACNMSHKEEISTAPENVPGTCILKQNRPQDIPSSLDRNGNKKVQAPQGMLASGEEIKKPNAGEETLCGENEMNMASSNNALKFEEIYHDDEGNRKLHVAEEGCDNVDKEKELSGTHATYAAHESEILKIFKTGAQHVNANEIEREAQEKVVELEEAYQDEDSEYARVNGKHVSCDEENECKLEGTSSDSEQSESAKLNGTQGACMPVENDLKGELIQDGNEVKLNSLMENTEEPEAQLEHQQNEKKQNADQVPSAVENTVEPGALGGDHADGENEKLKECNGVGLDETHNQVDAAPEAFLKASNKNIGDVQQGSRAENENLGCAAQEVCQKSLNSSHDPPETLRTVVTENFNSDLCKRERLESEKTTEREREYEKEQVRKLEEEKEREREREKDRLAVERATCEAHKQALAEARERAERIAVERFTAEARQRALTEAREKAERASAEALEKLLVEKALKEARLRAERAAVERATAEARERAVERALAEKAAADARQRAERLNPTSRDQSRKDNEAGDYFRMTDMEDREIKLKTSSSSSSQRYPDSSAHGEVESPLRCKARLERHQRTVERAAKALEEKNMRDILAQREQTERNRLAESLDADVRRWSTGKEGNLRALLSTLQYILGPESGWQPIPLTDVITAVAVKKTYRKATLYVHPDKLQQRGASIQQKYICEKVFDLLKEAWNRFNSEER